MLSIKDLNATEQEGLLAILEKHESSWTEAEVEHLQARADYLSSDDQARLDEATKLVADQKVVEAESADEAAKADAKAEGKAAKATK
jgi:uncharacterized membrane protein